MALGPLMRRTVMARPLVQGTGQASGVGQGAGGGMQTASGQFGYAGGVSPGVSPPAGGGGMQTASGQLPISQPQGTGQVSGHYVSGGNSGGSGIPDMPPPGTFDPALLAQLGQAQRGYRNLQQDTIRNSAYTTEDYNRAKDWTNKQTGWQVADLNTGRTREGQDYATGNQYRTQDFNTATAERQRQYGLLAQHQGSDQNAAGVLDSGAGALSAQIRAANQRREQTAAQTDFTRAQTAADLSHTRAGQDYGTARQKVHDTKYHALGDLGIQVGRTRAGYKTTLQRAGEELGHFKIDTRKSAFYEARNNQRWHPKSALVKQLKKRGLVY